MLVNSIILVDRTIESQIKNLKFGDSKIFSFDIQSHKLLERNNIPHKISDEYLDKEERTELFNSSMNYAVNWYKEKSIFNEIELESINLFSMMDTDEIQQYFLSEMIKFSMIKKIIESEKPRKIIAPHGFAQIIKYFSSKKEIKIEILGDFQNNNLAWDKIEIKFNLGSRPLSFYVSRKLFLKLKNIVETTVYSLFNLWSNLKNNEKTVLMIEFNPLVYVDLISHLHKHGINTIFLNRRRPAAWNFESVNIIRRYGCKILNFKKFLNFKEQKRVYDLTINYKKNLEKIFLNDKYFENFFKLEEHSLWPCIKEVLIEKYKERLADYIYLVLSLKKLFNKDRKILILSLNENGETEKTVLMLNHQCYPSIVLEHAFINYLSAEYDPHRFSPLLSDKIAVWGNIQKQHFMERMKFDEEKILVVGSPRHDSFYKKNVKNTNQKTILIAPHPITNYSGQDGIELYLRYENLIKNLFGIIKNIPDVNIVVKLHPGQNTHNDIIKKLIKEIDPTVPVFQITSIKTHLESCDVVVTISPDVFTSTVLLEAFILHKPTMDIFLMDALPEFSYTKDGAALSVSYKSNLEENIKNILFNERLRNELIVNSKKHLNNYLSNQGTASQHLAEITDSILS